MQKLELWYPVRPYSINQPFGNPDPKYQQFGLVGHNGVDLFAVHGQKVRAAHDGIVVFSGQDNKGGWGVEIRTTDLREYKDSGAYFKTLYWHLIPNFPVFPGQRISVGQVIGYADNTGFSTGDHLHFGLKALQTFDNENTWSNIEQANGYLGAIDPFPYFNGQFADVWDTLAQVVLKLKEILAKLGLK